MRPCYPAGEEVDMRLVFAGLLVAGCAGEYDGGQATETLGLYPYGGVYNPSLAGCKITDVTSAGSTTTAITSDYDGRGRLSVVLFESDGITETTSRWDGPCKVKDTTEAMNGYLLLWETTCDAEGWPVSMTQRTLDSQSGELDPYEYSWENTYEGGELVHVDASTGDATDLEWADGRVVRRQNTNINGVVDTSTYAFNSDGWVIEATVNELVTTYTYDDRGRLVSEQRGDYLTEWSYRDNDKRPYQRVSGEQASELDFHCP
jgi:hypothetical protein